MSTEAVGECNIFHFSEQTPFLSSMLQSMIQNGRNMLRPNNQRVTYSAVPQALAKRLVFNHTLYK